jgi:hypothetical protein
VKGEKSKSVKQEQGVEMPYVYEVPSYSISLEAGLSYMIE